MNTDGCETNAVQCLGCFCVSSWVERDGVRVGQAKSHVAVVSLPRLQVPPSGGPINLAAAGNPGHASASGRDETGTGSRAADNGTVWTNATSKTAHPGGEQQHVLALILGNKGSGWSNGFALAIGEIAGVWGKMLKTEGEGRHKADTVSSRVEVPPLGFRNHIESLSNKERYKA